uniref:Uncharacterized protein n=1 Tax=Callorhinchus milii TaxID=7868 RepID=A0A4W3JGH8_CALMI
MISISAVPDLSGVPPSSAIRTNLWVGCCSLSRRFSSNNSGKTFPSASVCTSRAKCLCLLSW